MTFYNGELSGLNLAEPGQSAMMTNGKLKLSIAYQHDTCHIIIQDDGYEEFIENRGESTCRGLN